MAEKVDFKKTLDAYRAKRNEFRILDVPELQYLMLDGHGDPNTSPAFQEAITSLYPLAYKLKFAAKRELGQDYTVPPLEGLWWAEDMEAFTMARDKAQWNWTLMIMVPDWIDAGMVAAVRETALAASEPGNEAAARLADVRLQALAEGRCVQVLHVGSFDDEAGLLARLHREYLPEQGLVPRGRHHEIYLSDFRRTAPEKLRTILRQPVSAAERHISHD